MEAPVVTEEVVSVAVEEAIPEEVQEMAPQDYPVELREFNGSLSNKYNGKDFDYTEKPKEKPKPQKNKSDSLDWLWNLLGSIGNFLVKIAPALLYIILGIGALIILYILISTIFDLQLNQKYSYLRKKKNVKTEAKENAEDNPEDIQEHDYRSLAQRAEKDGNYRLAYRYLFLGMLQNLELKKYIEWQKNKTNLDYIPEIQNDTIRKEYQQLAHYFDYIWYGKKPISELQYEESKKEFNTLNHQI